MKLRQPTLPQTGQFQSMAAMSDVVFLLLIFFIVTMGAFVKTTFIDTALPTAGHKSPAAQLSKTLQIEVLATGDKSNLLYQVNGIPHTKQQLKDSLERVGQFAPDTQILIRCEKESEHAQLVYLLSQCHIDHLTKISLMKPK